MADLERVMITGATGFIGSHLTRLLLSSGTTIHALVRPGTNRDRIAELLDHPRLNLHSVDLSEATGIADWLARTRVDACIHLAWSHSHPQASLSFSQNLVDGLITNHCPRVVLAGSCFEYDVRGNVPLTEESAVGPRQPTDVAKVELERYAQTRSAGSATTLVTARIFYVYGPGQPARHLVPSVTAHLLEDELAPLTSGQQRKDYLHVEDVASALWSVTRSELQGVVNIGSGQTVAVAEIATKIGEILQRAELIRWGQLPSRRHDPDFVCADNRKLLDSTNWRPHYDLDRGLRNTVEWWQRQAVQSGV